jgi:hypothetical protein
MIPLWADLTAVGLGGIQGALSPPDSGDSDASTCSVSRSSASWWGWAAASSAVIVTAVIRVLAVVFDLSLPEQRMLYRRKVAAETGALPIVKP